MKKTKYLMLIVVILSLFACKTTKIEADLIIHNARVYTVDDNFTIAGCLIVSDGKILAVGDDELLNKYESAEMLDAQGSFVYPGFIDAHCHFLSYGMNKMQRADLTGTTSFDEVIERVSAHGAAVNSEWLLGRGWDQNDWDIQEFPDREKLDDLFPDRPVVLIRIDGHAALVNGEALRRGGITGKMMYLIMS